MSKETLATLLALGTCISWGLITPMAIAMQRNMGATYHPLLPMFWNVLGGVVVSVIALVVTKFEPLRVWSWNLPGFVVGFIWPMGGVFLMLAVGLAPEKASILNAIGAIYFAIVSLPILWFFFNEAISPLRAFFLFGTAIFAFLAFINK